MAKAGIMIYFEVAQALKSLDDSQVGILLRAMLAYGEHGTVPAFADPSLSVAWAFVRMKLDLDDERYREKCLQGRYKVYCRECKKSGEAPVSYGAWREQQISNDISGQQMLSDDICSYPMISDDNQCYPEEPTTTTTTATSTTTTTTTATSTNNIYIPETPQKKSRRKRWGKFKQVLLSDPELEELRREFGADLTNKAVAYLDAYIEEKGYKSNSHDLTIRRWVMDAVRGCKAPAAPGGQEQANQRAREDMERIRRLMEEGRAGDG